MVKILFVCLGNICRSPLAEAIFNHKVRAMGLETRFRADSSGTSDYHIGETPDTRAIRNAMKNGVVMKHAGQQLKVSDLNVYDYVFAMDNNNYDAIIRVSHGTPYRARISLIREFDPREEGGEVPDPFFGGEKGFQEVFDMLDRSIENLIEFLRDNEAMSE